MRKQKTNIEILRHLMNGSAMNQLFIMNAIDSMANKVLSEERPDDWPEMINWEAWKHAAQEVKKAMEQ